jgi:hypothetical protein
VKARTAGVGSASTPVVATIETLCRPSASGPAVYGDEQGTAAA